MSSQINRSLPRLAPKLQRAQSFLLLLRQIPLINQLLLLRQHNITPILLQLVFFIVAFQLNFFN